MMFTIFDIIIFTIIAVSTLLGLYKGLINMLISLLGITASIIGAIFLYPYVEIFLIKHVANKLALSILSGIIAYISCLMAVSLITKKINLLLSGFALGFLDRSLGLIMGFLRGTIISIIIFAVIAIFSEGTYLKARNAEELLTDINEEEYPTWIANSKTTGYLEKLLKKSIILFPEDYLQSIELPKEDAKKEQDIIDSIKKAKESNPNL